MHYPITPHPELGAACPGFQLNNDPRYENRDFRFYGSRFLFDGYSHWFRGNPPQECRGFTAQFAFLPLTFSAHPDALLSCWQDNRGLEILVHKGGVISVRLGFGFPMEFSSIRAHVQAGMWNAVTVVFRGDAGWSDLYVNGVFSARKQFRRRMTLSFPEAPLYIGRRVDGHFLKEQVPFSCFYGLMEGFDLTGCETEEADILRFHNSIYTGIRDEAAFAFGMPQRETYRNDRNRPRYHLCPPGKWMNEPHGPMFHDGWYHIYYQGNPHAPIWDHLCWGHLKSRDMVHWMDCLPALIPEKEPTAPDGCWSGSSVIDKDGKPRIYFTAGNDGHFPNQNIALALSEDGDSWHSLPQLVQEQDMGWMGEFRDPFVWLEDDTYFMLVGSGDDHNGGGNAILYSSPDGLRWQNHGFLVDYSFENNTEAGHVWELPVLLPLKDETGKTVCHILLLCAAQVENERVETYYFLGHWDAAAKRFTKFHEKVRLLDLGKGVFTGPSGFVTPDGRSVVFTIAQGGRHGPEEWYSGWAHNGGLPVELSIRGGQVQILPIRELEVLRSAPIPVQTNADLAVHSGDSLCLDYVSASDTASVSLCYGDKLKEIRYDRSSRRLTVLDETGAEIGRYRGSEDDVDIGDEPIHFLCYLDRSMLEVYVNGRKAVSLRNYTKENRYFRVSGTPHSLSLWEMADAL